LAGKPLDKLNLEHLVKNVVTEKLLRTMGERAVDMVRRRTRLGYGVAGEEFGGSQQKLEKLAAPTKEKRARLKKQGRLSSETTPAKSNLTETGKLLDSIQFRVRGNRLEVFIAGLDNQLVASYVSDKRPFFTLTQPEVSRLADLIEQAIQNYLAKGK
jgi:hypothetical protein